MDNTAGSERPVAASRELMRLMGRIFANSDMYGPHHKLTTDAIEKSYAFMEPLLRVCERIDFNMADGLLLVEGEPAGTTELFINALSNRLTDVDLAGLSLLQGLTREEFGKLIEIMFMGVTVEDTEGKGMRQALKQYGVEHVYVQTVTYRTITEQEEVVLKNAEKAAEPTAERVDADEDKGSVVAQIMAFLKGDISVEEQQASKNLATMLLSNPERLAQFIMETAATQPGETMDSGEHESLADIIVARLERVRSVLRKEPTLTSAKRNTALRKNLLLLGKEILRTVQRPEAPPDPGAEVTISTFLKDMLDELEIKAIASEYAKKRASFAKAENTLIQQIKDMGVDNALESSLEEQLSEDGVPAADWRMLLVKADKGSVPGGTSEIVALLTKLDEMMSAGKPKAEVITGLMSQVNELIGPLAIETRQKIETFGTHIQQFSELPEDHSEPERNKTKQSLKTLLILLAEILQELCQPVSVMSGVIQMTVAGHLGPVNAQQKEMLEIAVESGDNAKQLLDRLIEIVGTPKGLVPDRGLLATR